MFIYADSNPWSITSPISKKRNVVFLVKNYRLLLIYITVIMLLGILKKHEQHSEIICKVLHI